MGYLFYTRYCDQQIKVYSKDLLLFEQGYFKLDSGLKGVFFLRFAQ